MRRRGPSGFTLLEVIVALVILAAGLLGLLEMFSGSLRLAGGARDVNAATVYASQRLEEALLAPDPAEGTENGLFGEKYRWVTRTSFVSGDDEDPYRATRVQVTIEWSDGAGEHAVSVAAVRWDRKESGAGG